MFKSSVESFRGSEADGILLDQHSWSSILVSIYTVYNAKTHLSSLIDLACAGEEVIIARGRLPLVKLVPLGEAGVRRFGAMRGKAEVTAAFFEPLPADEMAGWEP